MYTNKSRLQTVKEAMSAPVRKMDAALLGLCASAMAIQPTLCVTINKNVTMEGLFGGIVDLIIQIAFWIGAIILVIGVFQVLNALKDDNAEGQSRAIRLSAIGVAMMCLEVFLKLAGVIV